MLAAVPPAASPKIIPAVPGEATPEAACAVGFPKVAGELEKVYPS